MMFRSRNWMGRWLVLGLLVCGGAQAQIQPGALPAPKSFTPPKKTTPAKAATATAAPAAVLSAPVPNVEVNPKDKTGKSTPKVRNLSTSDLVLAISGSGTQILLYTRYLRNGQVAEALRVAAKERGVDVHIITPYPNLRDPGSYYLSLVANGVKVYALTVPHWQQSKAFMVVDQGTLVTGNLLGEMPTLSNPQTTRFTLEKSTVQRYFHWYVTAIQNRKPFYPPEGWIRFFGLGTPR